MEEVYKKRLHRHIDVLLLIGACSQDEINTIFGKLWNLRAFLFTLLVANIFSFSWFYTCYMDNEVHLKLIRHGIPLVRSNEILKTLTTFRSISGLISLPLLTVSNYISADGHKIPPLDEDYSYLVNNSRCALEEELDTLAGPAKG